MAYNKVTPLSFSDYCDPYFMVVTSSTLCFTVDSLCIHVTALMPPFFLNYLVLLFIFFLHHLDSAFVIQANWTEPLKSHMQEVIIWNHCIRVRIKENFLSVILISSVNIMVNGSIFPFVFSAPCDLN